MYWLLSGALIVMGFSDTSTFVGPFVSEQGRKVIEEIVEVKKRLKEGRGTGLKLKKQKK